MDKDNEIEQLKKQVAELQEQVFTLLNARPSQRNIFPDSTKTSSTSIAGYYEVFPGRHIPYYL